MDAFFRGQTNDAEIIALGKDYLSICCIFSVGLFAQLIFERLLQATGRTMLSMISQCTGAITNILCDPLLIFGVPALGIPAMGVTGAAIATVFGQIVGGIVAIVLNVRKTRNCALLCAASVWRERSAAAFSTSAFPPQSWAPSARS